MREVKRWVMGLALCTMIPRMCSMCPIAIDAYGYIISCWKKNSIMLLYSLPVDEDVELSIIQLTDKSVPEYFEGTYGIERGGGIVGESNE